MGTMKNPRLDLFPITVGISQTNSHSYLTISDCNLVGLAEQRGTPLYLYDRTTMDAMVDTYRAHYGWRILTARAGISSSRGCLYRISNLES